MLVWSSRREFVLTKELSGIGIASTNWPQILYSLKTSTWPTWLRLSTHAILAFPWSRLTPTYCLFSGCHFVDFIYDRMYLSSASAGFIADQGNIFEKETAKDQNYHIRKALGCLARKIKLKVIRNTGSWVHLTRRDE